MNKGDYTGEALVCLIGSDRVMTLGGTPDHWVCTWIENGEEKSAHFQPEELVPASNAPRPNRDAR